MKYYEDYFWKNGIPRGIKPASELQKTSYKVISDPYYKRISIERYSCGSFIDIVYDSALFDFRQLKQGDQTAWQKIAVLENSENSIFHIRNQDDRLILIEHYTFHNLLCKKCVTHSPQGIILCEQHIFYQSLNDAFDGVILYDVNGHAIMCKEYSIDSITESFGNLLKEHWDMSQDILTIALAKIH